MAHTWKSTQYKGVRYREHSTRKHGRQLDRYFNVRFQVAGVSVNEGYGWGTEGMSGSKAAILIAELKEELRTGTGTGKLSDRRKERERTEVEAKQAAQEQERRNITYEQYFRDHYLPELYDSQLKETTITSEYSIHRKWIIPAIGKVLIVDISTLHIQKVSHNIRKAGLAPRSIEMAIGHIRKVINHAIREKYYGGTNPVASLKKKDKPKVANKRLRFLRHREADRLLEALLPRSKNVHDMTLLSLHCGLRASEIFHLTWDKVDMRNKLIHLTNTKGGVDRTVRMTKEVRDMLSRRYTEGSQKLIFPTSTGKPRTTITKTFAATVKDLGLNDGVTDQKLKVVFHTCRHSCASWLVQAGVRLYQVKEILGHSSISLTERYSHLAPDGQASAMDAMEKAMEASRNATTRGRMIAVV